MNFLQKLMVGRHGFDQLCVGMLVLSMAVMATSRLSGWYWLDILALVVLMLAWIRAMSRNLPRRQAENRWFLGWWGPIGHRIMAFFWRVGQWGNRTIRHFRDSKFYRFYKCPSCKQKIRVPRGKGTISITCPKCKAAFTKKT